MNREEFLKRRQQGIGGSDVAAIMGLSKWKTPISVWSDKIGEVIVLDEDSKINNLVIGSMLESTVLELYKKAMNNPKLIITPSCDLKDNGFMKSEKYPWLLANVDAMATWEDTDIVIEAKTTGFYSDEWGDQGTDQIPIQYKLQVALYCLIAAEIGYKSVNCDIAALGSTHDFRIYHYERNKELEEQIIQATHDFWYNYVVAKEMPPATKDDDLKNLYKVATKEKVIVADNTVSQLAYDLKDVKQQLKVLEAREAEIKNMLKLYMKDSEVLIDIDGAKLASWKNQTAMRLDNERLKLENDALYKAYLKSSETRVFRS